LWVRAELCIGQLRNVGRVTLAEIADALEQPGYFCTASIGHVARPH
jgi:hypothetical protein